MNSLANSQIPYLIPDSMMIADESLGLRSRLSLMRGFRSCRHAILSVEIFQHWKFKREVIFLKENSQIYIYIYQFISSDYLCTQMEAFSKIKSRTLVAEFLIIGKVTKNSQRNGLFAFPTHKKVVRVHTVTKRHV
jgi:hypothetical protein